MTGFATSKGAALGASWTWDLRSVNGKGLDLRLRVPDWIDGLEARLRARLTTEVGRGNVTLNLRLSREEGAPDLSVNPAGLAAAITAMAQVEAEAMQAGLSLAPATAADVLGVRGVLESRGIDSETGPLLAAALMADFDSVLADFRSMRRAEGRALQGIIAGQLAQISGLVDQIAAATEARAADMAATLRDNLARVLEYADGADPQRVAQELALIAVKADVTEEVDRLRAHVDAARALLDSPEPVGRKLDFLMQEFNREANTLCSKSQHKALTRIGLDLKTVIDQMREQVQNIQ
ncbi:MAG: YicC family protein [Rhodobacterales bacterium]|nr:YicC family protein [Rhodobacterales bacterium]